VRNGEGFTAHEVANISEFYDCADFLIRKRAEARL
jgi:hypothetical protein